MILNKFNIPYLYSRSNVAAAIINDSIPTLDSESIKLHMVELKN